MQAAVWVLLASLGRSYEYKIALADRTWTGYEEGLRYIDHIKLLSNKLSNVAGAVAGLYRLSVGGVWEVSFDFIPSEPPSGDRDIFGFALAKEAVDAGVVEGLLAKKDYSNLKAAPVGVVAVLQAGQLRWWVNEVARAGKGPLKSAACPQVFAHMHIRLLGREEKLQLFVSDADDHNATLVDCGSLAFGKQPPAGFFLAFWARSRAVQWHGDVKHLLFESGVENTGIEAYFSHHDRSLPRLFRRINLLRSESKPEPPRVAGADLNVTHIHAQELACFQHLDVANHFLASNLEQTEELLSYFDQQQKAAAEFSTALLIALRGWVDSTSEQYARMAADSEELTAHLVEFDFAAAYRKTADLIGELRHSLEDPEGALGPMRDLARIYQEHLSLLQSVKRNLRQAPKLLAIVRQRFSDEGGGRRNTLLLGGLSGLGLLVIALQAVVLRRLKRAQQMKFFE